MIRVLESMGNAGIKKADRRRRLRRAAGKEEERRRAPRIDYSSSSSLAPPNGDSLMIFASRLEGTSS